MSQIELLITFNSNAPRVPSATPKVEEIRLKKRTRNTGSRAPTHTPVRLCALWAKQQTTPLAPRLHVDAEVSLLTQASR
eukprot:6189519-Pleurochrysis_carterae.AAC.4